MYESIPWAGSMLGVSSDEFAHRLPRLNKWSNNGLPTHVECREKIFESFTEVNLIF